MHEDATAVELRPHIRLLHGMRRPANWLQLVRFGVVGGIGFIVNLAVYTLFVHASASTTTSRPCWRGSSPSRTTSS